MAKKPLRIGIIGYGFMGRAHSNAYAKVGHFFDSDYQVVLQAACARNEDAVKSFAARWLPLGGDRLAKASETRRH